MLLGARLEHNPDFSQLVGVLHPRKVSLSVSGLCCLGAEDEVT